MQNYVSNCVYNSSIECFVNAYLCVDGSVLYGSQHATRSEAVRNCDFDATPLYRVHVRRKASAYRALASIANNVG